MVAFVASMLVLIVGVAIIVWYGQRRDPSTVLTWGEAFVAGTYAFFLLFWAYGVVPHQWLTWADNELNWRADELFLDTYAIDVSKAAVRDILVTGMYIAFLGGQIFLWVWWQKRGEAKEAAIEPSPYGRPLVKPQDGQQA